MERPCVLVVGAGLAGLCAAVTLAEAGRTCILLEREAEPGGLARSLEFDGVTFDCGPHVLFEGPGEGARMLLETLAREECITRRFAFAFRAGGRYWRFPNHFDVLAYPWRFQKEILTGLFSRRGAGGDSAREELGAKTGPGLYDLLFKGMLRKKTGLEGEALHRHWLMRPDRDALGGLEPAPRRSKLGTLCSILSRLNKRYVYPRTGFGRLPQALLERFLRAGGQAVLECGHVSLQREGGRVVSAEVRGRRFPVEHVVWTAPLNTLPEALGMERSVPQANAAHFEDALLVLATYDCPVLPERPYVYVYHPEQDIVFNRSSYPSSIFRELGPPGREGICYEITPAAVPGAMTTEQLTRRTLDDAARIGLPPGPLRQVRTLALPSALPVYGLDYQARMAEARSPFQDVPNLTSVGRLGGWYFCMSPEAAAQGLKAARRVLDARAE